MEIHLEMLLTFPLTTPLINTDKYDPYIVFDIWFKYIYILYILG